MFKVLVAFDGSEPAAQAMRLVADMSWPDTTSVRAVAVRAWDGPDRATLEHLLSDCAAQLARRLAVSCAVLDGRPASALGKEAIDHGADLLVVGNRGRGRLSSMLLGSVSAELLERAPCSVLVTRRAAIGRLLVAVDDSQAAAEVPRFLCRAGAFTGLETAVLSVSQDPRPWAPDVDPVAARAATRTASALQACGVPATREVRAGDPTATVIEAVSERSADLLVVGARGMSRLRGMLLGSVARNVAVYAPCSVLVVRRRRHRKET